MSVSESLNQPNHLEQEIKLMPQVRLKTKLMLLYMMSIISAQLLLGVESALISGIAKKGPLQIRET